MNSPTTPVPPPERARFQRKTFRVLGLTLDDVIKFFFGGNATVAVIVLVLITVFLFREGAGFFRQNAANLRIYRRAGLEYVDIIRAQSEEHTRLTRALAALRLRLLQRQLADGKSLEDANAGLAELDAYATDFGDAAEDVRGLVSELTEVASALKQRAQVNEDQLAEKAMLAATDRREEADRIAIQPIDYATEIETLRRTLPAYHEANAQFASKLQALLARPVALPLTAFQKDEQKLRTQTQQFLASFPAVEAKLAAWHYDEPIASVKSLTTFLVGRRWLTASFWQDWYGLVPLLVGSIFVSLIALIIAVPLGIAAAIYVSEIARPVERHLIKPYIEFISAIPSVVLGFFGIAVLGSLIRSASHARWLAALPGFPISERLNAFTAGALLALMAIPTIFSLAEDALSNVPRHLKEASYALGATRFQAIVTVLIPGSLSGIISAILLGFGRVVGETMVVLLCAGNRIAIPDFTEGLGAFFQPVHTMTGIIAQEMGEVVHGSIHYRALFMVGVVLFLLSLIINYSAQRIVRRYRISIG